MKTNVLKCCYVAVLTNNCVSEGCCGGYSECADVEVFDTKKLAKKWVDGEEDDGWSILRREIKGTK